MSPTIQQLIIDAKRLAERLKEHDNSASELLNETQNVHKQIESMREYREDVNELNDLARHQPHRTLAAGIRHENHQLKELQVENNELKTALEEHQNVLELVMTKYRQQVDALVQQGSRKAQATLSHKECNQKFQEQAQKIAEMLALMNSVALLDEQSSIRDVEKMTRLAVENKGLRDLMMISSVPPEAVLSHPSFQAVDTSTSVAESVSVSNTDTIKPKPKSSTSNPPQNSESSNPKELSAPSVESVKVKEEKVKEEK